MLNIRLCPKCNIEKPTMEFLTRKNKYYGLCKTCRTEYNKTRKEYRSKRYIENRGSILEKQKKYLSDNSEKRKTYVKKYHLENKDKIKEKSKEKWSNLSREQKREINCKKMGISIFWWNETFKSQNYSCAICKSEVPKSKNDFCIDHCHSSGKIRGILCYKCNLAIGYFQDDTVIINNAIMYLNKFKSDVE